MPPLTMSSTSFAVLHARVFCRCSPTSTRRRWGIDPRSIAERVTPRTRAIIPVAIYGLAPDLDAVMEVATRHGPLLGTVHRPVLPGLLQAPHRG